MSIHKGRVANLFGQKYLKACACKGATATTGQSRQRGGLISFYLGPSCDECGKAWSRVVEVRP